MIQLITKKYVNNEKGISLVELVVAVSIFSLVVTVASGIFINAIKAQRMMVAKQNIADTLRYTMEFMVKELKMARVKNPADSTFEKIIGTKLNAANSPSSAIFFTNSAGDNIEYLLLGNQIKRDNISGGAGAQPISSNEVKITGFSITANNWNLTAGPAPLITILIKAEAVNGLGGEMELQTSVAPRAY